MVWQLRERINQELLLSLRNVSAAAFSKYKFESEVGHS
jgi:hypothetical protein